VAAGDEFGDRWCESTMGALSRSIYFML